MISNRLQKEHWMRKSDIITNAASMLRWNTSVSRKTRDPRASERTELKARVQ